MENYNSNTSFFEKMEKDISKIEDESIRKQLIKNLLMIKDKKINILITGATGSGKSSTINAFFNAEVAKVGSGADPETQDITKYELDNLILWDSPGLGDGKEPDLRHSKNIIRKLNELDSDGAPVIDLVLVILDGSTRDYGTSYELINKVIIPNMGKDKEKRILIAINQADVAMKGRYWNYEKNCPEPQLEAFLAEKAQSVKNRIFEATGVNIMPICYSAGYKEEGLPQGKPYNLTKLLMFIVNYTPAEKRLAYFDNINKDNTMWESDDGLEDYKEEVRSSFKESFMECVTGGSEIGAEIGSIFGHGGEVIGKVVGGVIGGVVGVIGGIFSGIGSLFGL